MQKADEAKPDEVKQQEKQKENDFLEEAAGENRSEFHNLVDILFVIDSTGSMSWCMGQMKSTIKKIINKFAQKQYNIKFAIEIYRDHPPQEYSYIEKHFNLMNEDEILKIIDKECDVGGGGDTPQAVMDGLYQGLKKTSWRVSSDNKTKSKRFLFHGCDAPPHGDEYGSQSSQKTWRKNGCPCGITRHDIKKLLLEHEVDYSLIKCGTTVNIMQSLFKQCFENRFKKVMQIVQQTHKKKKKKEASVSDSGSEDEEQCMQRAQRHYGSELEEDCMDYADECIRDERMEEKCMKAPMQLQSAPKKKQTGFFSSLKEKLFGSSDKKKKIVAQKERKMELERKVEKRDKKERKKKEKKEKKKEASDDDDEDRRSMASLVLSQVQSGLDEYFGDDLKKEKKEKRKKKTSADLGKKPDEEKKEEEKKEEDKKEEEKKEEDKKEEDKKPEVVVEVQPPK